MRALAGPATLLVMFGGFAIFRMCSKEEAPSRAFTELEFAGQDHAGSCYSLSSVLIANRALSGAVRTWTSPREDTWTLTLDDIEHGYGGQKQIFQKFTFEKSGEQVRLVSVEASKDRSTDLAHNIDELLETPRKLGSTPVERCQLEKPRR
jgi:hypothetical protein